MTGQILMINTMLVHQGQLTEFEESVARAVAFVEANAPQLMVNVYLDRETRRAQSFQLYPDSAAIREHWRLSDPYIEEVSQHITIERLDLYGEVDEAVDAGLQPLREQGIRVTCTPWLLGFTRLG